MNRKTFLSSLLALITASFLGKSKESGIPLKGEPISGLIEPEPRLKISDFMYEKDDHVLTIYIDGEPVNCLRSTYHEDYQEPPFLVTTKQTK